MPKKKSKPGSPFLGRWHIISLSMCDEDFLNEEVRAFIEFEEDEKGSFRFGYVRGIIDYREGLRDGQPCVERSSEGNDEMDPAMGRDWAVLEGDGLLEMISFHLGDESKFGAGSASSGANHHD
jgi:hypothetical protein